MNVYKITTKCLWLKFKEKQKYYFFKENKYCKLMNKPIK